MDTFTNIIPTQQNSNVVGGVFSNELLDTFQAVLTAAQYDSLIDNINAEREKGNILPNGKIAGYDTYFSTAYKDASDLANDNDDYLSSVYGINQKSAAADLSQYGVINMPHQWTKEADPRFIEQDWRGRAYTQHILVNTPQILLKVGKPNYMLSGGKKDSDKGVISNILNTESEEERSAMLSALFDKNGNNGNETYYYTFEDDWDNYAQYVNGMVRYTAVNMGIDKYKNFDIRKETDNRFSTDNWFKDFFDSSLDLTHYLSFYIEGNSTSVTDSLNNSTTESQIASSLKNLGQTKRELDFLFGADTKARNNADATTKSYDDWANNLKSTYTGIDGIDGVLNKLSGVSTTIQTGANLLFPEIWSDSQFHSDSVNIEIKLVSPYGDKLSIFENIYIPLIMWMAAGMPRQSGKQGYTGPFICQCQCKGWFTINCGMISDISIKKGGSSGKEWSVDNLPTEIDLNISIKDLYPTIMATSAAGYIAFANNIGLTEYLKTMSGIQLTDFNPTRNIQQVINTLYTGVTDIPRNIYQKAQTFIGNTARKTITKIFGGLN